MNPGFTGSPLDRVDHIRNDVDAYTALLSDMRARILGLEGLDPMVAPEGGLVWQSIAEYSQETEFILLGIADDNPHFVPLVTASGDAFRSPAIWRALSMLPAADAAVYGTARSLIDWHNAHGFCGRCGGSTKLFRAGWGRQCSACNAEHFPRTDPVVIMLAEYEGKALIGRQKRFPPGNYSALAGFLEPGENIEEAVRREIMEEAGVTCGEVRYVVSQPWPFGGSQLMIACVADALGDEITLDTNELEDAMWVTREEARAALSGAADKKFGAPPPFAIAHSLLKYWAQDE
ncbi:MAG: NAD(+) diphosphatase [Sphingorhabdus sp.]